MPKGKELGKFNINQAQSVLLKENLDCGIYEIKGLQKTSPKILEKYLTRHKNFNKTVVLKINKDTAKDKKTSWLIKIYKNCTALEIDYLIVPFEIRNAQMDLIGLYSLFVQKLNGILMSSLGTTNILIDNSSFNLAGLSYIIQHVSYPEKTGIYLDIDILQNPFFTLEDIKSDILKYDIAGRIKIIKYSQTEGKKDELKDFMTILPQDIIVVNAET